MDKRKMQLLARVSLVLVLGCGTIFAQARGGSNYGWYNLSGCNREAYGVIANYHTEESTINAQLQTMYNNGQRRLRIPIFHASGQDSGTIMSSSGGNLSTQHRSNLTNLLAEIESIGYSEIEVSFHPQASNNPLFWPAVTETPTWANPYEDVFQENWNLIYNLRPIIAEAGMLYRIDLLNEGIPASSQTGLRQYAQRLWNYYVYTFGKNDTVGFSIIGTSARASQV